MSCPTFSSQIVKDPSPTVENWDDRLPSSTLTTYKRLVVSESIPVDLKKNPRHKSRTSMKELLLDKGKVNRTVNPLLNTVCDFRKTMGGIPK